MTTPLALADPPCNHNPCAATCPKEIMRVAYGQGALPPLLAIAPRGWFWRWWNGHLGDRRHLPQGYQGLNMSGLDPNNPLQHRLHWQ